jgi:hypothetical protein
MLDYLQSIQQYFHARERNHNEVCVAEQPEFESKDCRPQIESVL